MVYGVERGRSLRERGCSFVTGTDAERRMQKRVLNLDSQSRNPLDPKRVKRL